MEIGLCGIRYCMILPLFWRELPAEILLSILILLNTGVSAIFTPPHLYFTTVAFLLFIHVTQDKINKTSVYEYSTANTPEGFRLHFSLIIHKLDGEGHPDFIFLFLHCEAAKLTAVFWVMTPRRGLCSRSQLCCSGAAAPQGLCRGSSSAGRSQGAVSSTAGSSSTARRSAFMAECPHLLVLASQGSSCWMDPGQRPESPSSPLLPCAVTQILIPVWASSKGLSSLSFKTF